MSGNKRIYFPCIGISRCNENNILNNIITAELGFSISINNILSPGTSSPIASYSDLPEVDFSYTEYMQNFIKLENEYGLNNFVGWDLVVGADEASGSLSAGLFSGSSTLMGSISNPASIINGSPPYAGIRCSLAYLSSIQYNLSVDGFFTTKRDYKGYSKQGSSGLSSKTFTESQETPKRRQCYVENLPYKISNNAVQSIDVTYTINRTSVPEFATRKPYALYVNFPIETSVTFELLSQQLDSYSIDSMQTACKNITPLKENIIISVDGSSPSNSLVINNAYITSLRYGGASAQSNDNQTISVTYTSYDDPCPPGKLKPVIFMPDEDSCD